MNRIKTIYQRLAQQRTVYRYIGIFGFTASSIAYVLYPSFPTPDKILVFIILGAMIFSQAIAFTIRFVPFILILYVYEAFRGLAHVLNNNVNYLWMPSADRFLFGSLPTETVQKWLWHGTVQWYDFVLYLAYMAHFIMPLLLAVVIWKKFATSYWRFVATYALLSFAGFVTYLLFPAAPPWMASEMGLIEPIHRISSDVWFALGVNDFSTVYSQVAPNPVAAVPSLHSAYALTFALFITTLFKSRYKYLSFIFPALIGFGTVYQGEHYVIDAILGWIYAIIAFLLAKKLAPIAGAQLHKLSLIKRLKKSNADIV